MFGFFKSDPIKKKQKEYDQLLEKARNVQRSGDIKGYAKIIAESELLMDEILKLKVRKN
ncbi:MAG: DUF6435 family protein [Chitinophagales bacterium]